MRRLSYVAIAIGLLVSILAGAGPIGASAAAPFAHFKPAKQRLARFTKSLCFGAKPCKHRVRHCRRWGPSQIGCQSELLTWERFGRKDQLLAVTYCHLFSSVELVHVTSGRLEVFAEPKPTCQAVRHGPHWPTKNPG